MSDELKVLEAAATAYGRRRGLDREHATTYGTVLVEVARYGVEGALDRQEKKS